MFGSSTFKFVRNNSIGELNPSTLKNHKFIKYDSNQSEILNNMHEISRDITEDIQQMETHKMKTLDTLDFNCGHFQMQHRALRSMQTP